MEFTKQRKLYASLEMQKVIDLQIFISSFEQKSEILHQGTLKFFDDTRTTSPGVVICALEEMNVHRSVFKRTQWSKPYSMKIPVCLSRLQLLKLACIIGHYGNFWEED